MVTGSTTQLHFAASRLRPPEKLFWRRLDATAKVTAHIVGRCSGDVEKPFNSKLDSTAREYLFVSMAGKHNNSEQGGARDWRGRAAAGLTFGLCFVAEPHQLGENVVDECRRPQLVEHGLDLLSRIAQLQSEFHLGLILSLAGRFYPGCCAALILTKLLHSAALGEAGPVEARRAAELPVGFRDSQGLPLLTAAVHLKPLVLLLFRFALGAASILRLVSGMLGLA